jgi:hypothetical protein
MFAPGARGGRGAKDKTKGCNVSTTKSDVHGPRLPSVRSHPFEGGGFKTEFHEQFAAKERQMEYVILWVVLAIFIGALASSRGRSGFGFFLLSVVFSPLLGLIIVLVMGDLKEAASVEEQRRRDHERDLEALRAVAAPSVALASKLETQSAAGATVQPTAGQELERLAGLLDRQLITREEFDSAKQKLLGGVA